MDTNTLNGFLKLSADGRTVTHVREDQLYPPHADRFECWQLLCSAGLTGRCYWEVEWTGGVRVAVAYRGISRRGNGKDCVFGWNHVSWSINCSDGGLAVWHDNQVKSFPPSSSRSDRVAVYLDWPAGSLSFYRVSSGTLVRLHTHYSCFTEPLYAGFRLWLYHSSVFLCPP